MKSKLCESFVNKIILIDEIPYVIGYGCGEDIEEYETEISLDAVLEEEGGAYFICAYLNAEDKDTLIGKAEYTGDICNEQEIYDAFFKMQWDDSKISRYIEDGLVCSYYDKYEPDPDKYYDEWKDNGFEPLPWENDYDDFI